MKFQHSNLQGKTNTTESGSLIYLYKTQGIVHSEGAAQHTEKDGAKKLLLNEKDILKQF